jgi:hypothetical protein
MEYFIGAIVVDSAYFGKIGRIKQVDDYDSCCVIHVLWHDGTQSDFMPDENTEIVDDELPILLKK